MIWKLSKGLLLAAALLAQTNAGWAADDYPSRPIHLIVPAAPGSSLDPAALGVANVLTKLWGQRVVIENRPGAGGTVAFEQVARAKPDGYTIVFSTATLSILPATDSSLPFDPSKDFTAITMLASLPITLVASPSVPVNTIPELIAKAKEEPGKLTFGSGGEGTTNDLAAVLLAQKAGIDILRVPYHGASGALTAVLGNEINFAFASTANTVSYIKNGSMKAIALTTADRQSVLPDTPTIAETLPGYEVSNWYGLLAPAGLPEDILAKWTDALAKVKQDPTVQKFYANAGAVLEVSSPQVMDDRLHKDIAQWKEVVSHLPKKASDQ
jgi:tripartite-type tricarboxylate transporter receptor subunit TctC